MLGHVSQGFLVVVALTTLVGFARGWSREIVTCAFVLGGVLFLNAGGEQILAQWVFVRLPQALHLPVGTISPGPTAFLSLLALLVMTLAGYAVGQRMGQMPLLPHQHALGALPGAAGGAAIAHYVSQVLFTGTGIAQPIAPDAATRAGLLPVAAVGLGILLLVVLWTATVNRGKG